MYDYSEPEVVGLKDLRLDADEIKSDLIAKKWIKVQKGAGGRESALQKVDKKRLEKAVLRQKMAKH